MSAGSDRKRKHPKAYYKGGRKQKKNNFSLEIGMRGFLITCNFYERECVWEAYNVLNEYTDKLYGPEKPRGDESADDKADIDIEDALDQELAELKKPILPRENRFQVIESGANNVVIIRTTLTDPAQLVHYILEDTRNTKTLKSRHIQRLLPISAVCRASVDAIGVVVEKLTQPYFGSVSVNTSADTQLDTAVTENETSEGTSEIKDTVAILSNVEKAEDVDISEGKSGESTPCQLNEGRSFCVVFKARNNNSVRRVDVQEEVTRVIMAHNSRNWVDLNTPDYVITVDVIRSKCCVSVIRDYFEFKKYNLHELAVPYTRNKADSSTEVSTEGTPLPEDRSDGSFVDCATEKLENA